MAAYIRYAKKHGWGEWYGARRAGIGNRQGLGGPSPAAHPQHTSTVGNGAADSGPGWQWPFREQRHIGETIDNSIKPPMNSGSPGDAIKGPNNFEAPHGHAFTTAQLDEFRRKAAEPVRVKVKYDYEDVRGIRDRGEAQGRRTFARETRRARYA